MLLSGYFDRRPYEIISEFLDKPLNILEANCPPMQSKNKDLPGSYLNPEMA